MTDSDRLTEIRHLNADGLYGPGRIRADIDFLLARVERLRAELDDIHNNPRHPAVAKLQECRRQRDALQARLGAMETEWGVRTAPDQVASIDADAVEYARSRELEIVICERTPWRGAEVSDADPA